jgi:hypothetical protein
VTETLFPMADLADRWGVTPNTVSRRLAYLGIKPIRQGNFRFLTPDQLDQANALHDHVLQGKPMETFPKPSSDGLAVMPRKGGGAAASLGTDSAIALAAAMAAHLAPPADPLLQARRLKEAADLGVWLTNGEMAEVIGMAESTLRDKSHDYSPRPGFQLERRQDAKGGAIWWRVRQEGGSVTPLPTSGATSRPVGFAGAIEARYHTISAAIELPCW